MVVVLVWMCIAFAIGCLAASTKEAADEYGWPAALVATAVFISAIMLVAFGLHLLL